MYQLLPFINAGVYKPEREIGNIWSIIEVCDYRADFSFLLDVRAYTGVYVCFN